MNRSNRWVLWELLDSDFMFGQDHTYLSSVRQVCLNCSYQYIYIYILWYGKKYNIIYIYIFCETAWHIDYTNVVPNHIFYCTNTVTKILLCLDNSIARGTVFFPSSKWHQQKRSAQGDWRYAYLNAESWGESWQWSDERKIWIGMSYKLRQFWDLRNFSHLMLDLSLDQSIGLIRVPSRRTTPSSTSTL